MSSRNGTLTGQKRTRSRKDEDEPPSLPSNKKRRLNDGPDASPRVDAQGSVRASTQAAIREALGLGGRLASGRSEKPAGNKNVLRRRSSARADRDEDEDEDREAVDAQKSQSKRRHTRTSAVAASLDKDDVSVYDIPDSGDELSILSTTDHDTRKNGKKPASRRDTPNAPSTGVGSGKKRGSLPKNAPNDAEPAREDHTDAAPVESAVRSRSRKHLMDPSSGQDEAEISESENGLDRPLPRPETRTRPLSHGKSARASGKPRGILTPHKTKDAERRRKSVAFSGRPHDEQGEVTFEDLPNKADRTTNLSSRNSHKNDNTEATRDRQVDDRSKLKVQSKGGDQVDQSDEAPEDDEVCAVCSRPDSKARNQIIFCDGCNLAVHQKCYGVQTIPKGDWFCRDCSQETTASAFDLRVKSKGLPRSRQPENTQKLDIPNFDHHLRVMQRVLVDRCTGRRRIKLQGQEESYDKVFQLVQQTIVAGEGNSMLVIGARGCGKSTMVEQVLSEMTKEHKTEFHTVRLNGFIHTDDKLALKEIWRQLGKEMEVEDDLTNRTTSYADTLTSLLALLSHPSEMAESQDGVTSKSVIFVMDEFDLFATHTRQTLLYNLFDIAQSRKAPIAVLGLTTRIDVVETLEKRVKSRFSHRYAYLSLPKDLMAYWAVCQQGLMIAGEDMKDEGIDVGMDGHSQFQNWWNSKIEALYETHRFKDVLEYHFLSSKCASAFWNSCILPLTGLSPACLSLDIAGSSNRPSIDEPDSKLHLLASLSDLDLAMLIAAARLDVVADTDVVNFAMAYDEYTRLMGRQRVQSATSGLLAVGGGARVWGRGVAGMAWERLVTLGLLLPAGMGSKGAGAAASGHGGLGNKMWRVDVVLEDIPAAVKMNAMLTKWCREI